MTILGILCGLQLVLYAATVLFLIKWGREERATLEDRLMALATPDALVAHKALENPEPGDVSYVDEKAEWNLQDGGNSHVELMEEE